jgi:predicted transcriptional regulator
VSETAATPDVFLTVRITPDLRDALKTLADENDRTVAAEIRRALRMHVDRQEEK